MVVWHRRAVTRRHLANLDDEQLRDIGKSRGDAAREASNPSGRLDGTSGPFIAQHLLLVLDRIALR